MLQQTAVFSSDEINSLDIQMPMLTLAGALEQGWESGQPMFLGHDMHRLAGWSAALGMYLEPGLARLAGLILSPESEVEEESLKRALFGFTGQKRTNLVEPYLDDLKQRLSGHLTGEEEPAYMSCAALVGEGLATRVFPEAFEDPDKSGLVPMRRLNMIAPGVFEQCGILFFASSFLRRSLSRHNTLNAPFLARLQNLVQNPDVEVRIRLDPDAVGLASTYMTPVEFAHWWGPHFTDNLDELQLGITRHEADDRQRVFSGVYATEFWWHQQDGLKTLECEELLDVPTLGAGADSFGCRYVHLIDNPDQDTKLHLDGAIRMYQVEQFLERMDKPIHEAGRHSEYSKLWRIDGDVAIETWKELVTHFYRDNELVGEYLGGEEDKESEFRPEILDPHVDPLSAFVPCNMDAGDGARVMVSFHHLSDRDDRDESSEIAVVPMDKCGSGDDRDHYIEADSIEIVKLLRKRGQAVTIPNEVKRLAFEDTVVNLAMFSHTGESAVANAEATLQAIATLMEAWVERADDRLISCCIEVVYVDRAVRFSLAGHVNDLHSFLSHVPLSLPAAPDEVPNWLETAYPAVGPLTSECPDKPPLARVLQQTGILQFKRNPVSWEFLDIDNQREGTDRFRLAIPNTETVLVDLIKAGTIICERMHEIIRSKCSSCEHSYCDCNCSKYLSSDVCQQVEESQLLGFFWTNRSANRSH